MKPEDRKRLKQHVEMIVEHKVPAELSSIGKIKRALTVARLADVGCELSRFDVIELSGFIADMEEDSALATHELAAYQLRIRELEETTDKAKKIIRDFLIGFSIDVFGVVPNGNSAFGCDEGVVRGNEYLRELVKRAELYNHTDIVDEMSVDVKNTNPDYYNHAKTSTDNYKCSWIQEDDPDIGLWRTGCKNTFYLDADKPSDNHMKYCCYCGREIKEED